MRVTSLANASPEIRLCEQDYPANSEPTLSAFRGIFLAGSAAVLFWTAAFFVGWLLQNR